VSKHKLLSFLSGRWSSTPPEQSGVYFMRLGAGRDPQVRPWDLDPWSPSTGAKQSIAWEFFYIDSDVDGAPSRADDVRVHELARKNGWTPVPTRTLRW
jgi:hypothetical protein